MKSIQSTLFALSVFLLANSPAFAGSPSTTGDSAYITQAGAGVTVTTNQTETSGNPNTITVIQFAESIFERADVTQSGSGNNRATVNQYGDSEVARVKQLGASGNASVNQDGNLNAAKVTQGETSVSESATIEQVGGGEI